MAEHSLSKFLRFSLILSFICFWTNSSFASPKEVTIKTKISKDITLIYEGLAEKKVPCGKGSLSVFKNGEIIDKIVGIFDNTTITNSNVTCYPEEIVFFGDLSYTISSPENADDMNLVYSLKGGVFSIYRNGLNNGVSFSKKVNDSINITRMLDAVSLSPDFICIKQKLSKQLRKDYSELIGKKPEVYEAWTDTLFLSRKSLTHSPKSIFLDYGDRGFGTYKDNQIMVICSNGDSLIVNVSDSSYSRDDIYYSRNVEGGKIIYNENKNGTTGFKSIFSSRHDHNVKSDKYEEYYSGLPERIQKSEGFCVVDRLEEEAKNNGGEFLRKGSICPIEVIYNNGDTYYGKVYVPKDADSDRCLSFESVPEIDNYQYGVHTTAKGLKTYYYKGYEVNEFLSRVQKIEDKEREESERRLEAYARYQDSLLMNSIAVRNEQTKKYGKKYVDAIYDDYTILVGTPLGLLEEKYLLNVSRETESFVVYEVKWGYSTQFVVWVNKSTKRVDEVVKK